MAVEIEIRLRGNAANNRYPHCRLELNSKTMGEGIIVGEQTIRFSADLREENILGIVHENKSNRDTVTDSAGNILEDRSIEVLGVSIGGLEILHTVLNMQPFYVQWPDNIVSEFRNRNEDPPAYLTNNLYLGFNGTYELTFLGNIERMRFEQLWMDEKQAHANQTQINDGKETFNRIDGSIEINREFDLTIHDLADMMSAGE